MSVTTTLTPISTPMVLAKIDEALSMDYRCGVIGLRGSAGPAVTADLTHRGQTVRVRPAESALAAREVLTEHRDGDWMVVVTDRDDDDLGAGILAHFVWQRLRNPDPWEAVRHRFAATGIDPLLTNGPDSSELAIDLLAATPPGGWPAAPAGVLTRAHALGAVASTHLGYDGDAGDAIGVLRWTMTATSVTAVETLRHGVGERLADATLAWIAERAAAAAQPISALLTRGELADVVPLGVVLRLLTSADLDAASRHQAQLALVRLEPRWGDTRPSEHALTALGVAADALLSELVHDKRADDDVERAVRRADDILTQAHAADLAQHSDLLPGGLRARLATLAAALRHAVEDHTAADASPTQEAWERLHRHRLAGTAPAVRPFTAAVRLVRWLAQPDPDDAPPGTPSSAALAALANRYLATQAWADAAINHAFSGVDDPELSPSLQAVVTCAMTRRREQDRRFAAALASAGTSAPARDTIRTPGQPVWYLERLLTGAVFPLARKTPVLLLVMDGMSAACANDILDDATHRLGWTEAALPDAERRTAAIAVLPTITELSRASLLCGRLTEGDQGVERAGYAELTAQTGKIKAALFHKKGIDTTTAGWSLSHDVGEALDDPDTPLVTVVLNTIDDALDRSDPAGTTWTADAVKHLEPLLVRAAAAQRVVVLTADHGHIVERRLGTQRTHPEITSGRSRAARASVGDDEIEVSGARVLTHDHRAVLAVDDTLRYGPLKAGYHGGATPAEVVVPVAVLVRDDALGGLTALAPQQPAWWNDMPTPTVDAAPVAPAHPPMRAPRPDKAGATLFDLAEPAAPQTPTASLGRSVVRTSVYRAQRKLAARLIVTDDHVARLVDALAAAPATRLSPTAAAQALGVPQTRLRGALTQIQQLLNVEGYPVVASDAATGIVVLDTAMLGEQFGVLA